MSVWEIIKAVLLVIVELHLLISFLFGDSLLHVIAVLLLLCRLFLILNLLQLIDLLLDTQVLKAFFLDLIDTLFCFCLLPCLRLLLVLFHVVTSLLMSWSVHEKGTLAPMLLLIEVFLKGHVREELILFQPI